MPKLLSKDEYQAIQEANNSIQDWVSQHGAVVPNGLLHLLSNLDFTIQHTIGRGQ